MPLVAPGLTLLIVISAGGPPVPSRQPVHPFGDQPAGVSALPADEPVEEIVVGDTESSRGWSTEGTVKGAVDVVGRSQVLAPVRQPDADRAALEAAGAVAEEGGSRFRKLLRPGLKLGLLGLAGLAVAFGVVVALAGSIARLFTGAAMATSIDRSLIATNSRNTGEHPTREDRMSP